MRTALRAKSAPRARVSVVKSYPAPVGGWNARDPLANMKPTDAVTLENWFPRESDCIIRGGNSDHVTGFAAVPKSFLLYTPPTGSPKMFASTDAAIYDVTSAGALGASVQAVTNGYIQWLQMGVSGGHFLLLFNGTDTALTYNGTVWAASGITGVTTSTLITANVFKRRLFVMQSGKLSFWYLAVDAVAGAATEFLLGPLCAKGGFTMAMATWTFDGGSGPDDYAVFVTSEGEVIVFSGTNPGDSTAWLLVGVYFVGKPIGRKCFQKLGGDLILITEFGAFPLSKALQSASIDYKLALTNKIEGAFVTAARNYRSNVGWEGQVYPGRAAFIFNIPTSATTFEQYVMNTTTRAWCKFTGWHGAAFIVFNSELYFAEATRIAKAWTGASDKGANVIADAKTAYNYFAPNTQEKQFKLFRPMLLVDGNLTFSVGLSVDFQQNIVLSEATYSVTSGARWDVDLWDIGIWAAGLEIHKEWQSPAAYSGFCAAGLLKVTTNMLEVQWVANDYLYESGGVL